ncbi:MAG: asparagine synthase (glutamine-hydrolyzing) [Polyangiaceae bacterium]
MCGLTGALTSKGQPSSDLLQVARQMANAIAHRGPDDSGEWSDESAGYAVGFRRLAIIDLSAAGHQPMHSASGRYVIAFNGEVYNFEAVRAALAAEGHRVEYRGHSDTEVMLAAIEAWGLEKAVTHFVGMFAFALWDRQERVLHLVRDRLGVKPMYYGVAQGVFLFGSELKALRAHPAFDGEIDRDSLTLLLRHCYIPGPFSIYRKYRKLPPGTILSVRDVREPLPEPKAYWSAAAVAEQGLREPHRGSPAELTQALDELLRDGISMRMVADVPVGVFLSGGIDSSLVTGIMQSLSNRSVRTFTIGFNESGYNEAQHARAIARHLHTEHTELYVSPQEARDIIPRLPQIYDEPFADSSQIPTFLVSEMARRHVTVCLTGDGGDELFAGYERYEYCASIWNVMRRLPRPVRRLAASSLVLPPSGTWDRAFGMVHPVLPRMLRIQHPQDKARKLAGMLRLEGLPGVYRDLISYWRQPADAVLSASEPSTPLSDRSSEFITSDAISRMMYLDLVTYLPDDILVKVDRASMGVSLEAREPLIDHRLVEFAWRLPIEMKVQAGVGKWLLRRVLDKYVPRALFERPKMGFGVPLREWLRGPLRDWAEELLSERRLASDGFFAPSLVRARWKAHLTGTSDASGELWSISDVSGLAARVRLKNGAVQTASCGKASASTLLSVVNRNSASNLESLGCVDPRRA